MISKTRLVVVTGLVLAMAVAATAWADGTGDNTPEVIGSIKEKKLDKKKYKPVELTLGVATNGPVNGSQACHPSTGGQCNPEAEFIKITKNIKWKSNAAPYCTASLNGTTTAQAEALCPPGSNIGKGTATVTFPPSTPGGANTVISDETVTVFNGPATNQVRLHAYSPTLTATNTQVILGEIVSAGLSARGGSSEFGKALRVADAPDAGGDAAMITSFGATLPKGGKVVLARCKDKSMTFERTVTYDDGSKETVQVSDTCKRKKSGGGGGGNN
jgi:hypothetical protein